MVNWTITTLNDGTVTLDSPSGLYKTTNDALFNMTLQAALIRMRYIWEDEPNYWTISRNAIPKSIRSLVIRIMACDTLNTLTPAEIRAYSEEVTA